MSARGIAAALAVGLLAAACNTVRPAATPGRSLAAQPAPAPHEVVVRTPVKIACVPKTLPPPPRYPDSDTALRDAGGAADRYQLLAAGRILRARRLAQLERVIEGCR